MNKNAFIQQIALFFVWWKCIRFDSSWPGVPVPATGRRAPAVNRTRGARVVRELSYPPASTLNASSTSNGVCQLPGTSADPVVYN